MRTAQARLFGAAPPVKPLPKEWVAEKGPDVLRYANYIYSLRLRTITPEMVLAPHFKTTGRVRNTLPPREMWTRIAPTLRVVDEMSLILKTPVEELLSIYRSPRYNQAVRGRSRSQHMDNIAIDVRFRGVPSHVISKLARRMRAAGRFSGGVGHYSSFTHIDTRGFNVDW